MMMPLGVLTSHRPSPVDAQAPQRPPWATVHRPIRSRRYPAETGKQVITHNPKLLKISQGYTQDPLVCCATFATILFSSVLYIK